MLVRRGLPVALAALLIAVSASAEERVRPAPSRTGFIRASSVAPQAGALTADERSTLLAGETVARPLVFERDGGRYVGGVSYQVVRAIPEEVIGAVLNVEDLPSVLPRTKRATLVDVVGSVARVELVQGNAVVESTYTVQLERTGPGEVRFQLDPSRPHGIKDVWGYFRARPFGKNKTLITVAVALDVGPGLVRLLFEERIQRVALETPRHIKDYVEPRALALR
jgi:hypothetical protein